MDKLGAVGGAASAAMTATKVSLSQAAKAAAGEALRDARGGGSAVAPPSGAFGNVLRDAIGQVSEMQKSSSDMSRRFQLGDPTISLEETMIASQKASLAFQAALQVRNRVVQTYQDIMQMTV